MSYGNIHLTPQLVQAVRDAVEIEAIAGEHTHLKKMGRRLKGLCPLHKEKTPSFSVDPDQGLFYCFGCGRGGDAIKLHMMLSGDDFPGAIESLANRYAIPLPARRQTGRRADDKIERIEGALERAAQFFRTGLERSDMARDYLRERQIPDELIESFALGYAPEGWENLLKALHPEVPLDDLVAAGLVGRSEKSGKPYDRFRNRLIFPIRNAAGRLVGFGGRAMDDDKAKYVNTAETDRFHKGRLLYGLDLAKRSIRDSGRVLLVEGYFDVIGAVAAGVPWTVASMGTALTPDQAKMLARYADEVVVGYDGDEAGQRAFRNILPLLLEQGVGALRLRLDADQDPDSLRLEQGAEALLKGLSEAPDAVVLELGRLIPSDVHRNPRTRAAAGRAVVELLEPIPDGILRYGYGRQASDRLGVPVELLWRRLGVDRESLKGAPEQESGPRESQSLEKRLIQLLLEAGAEVPPVEELPPPEALHDQLCGNILATFLALYRQDGRPPEVRAVRDALGDENEAVDQLARILLEGSVSSVENELPEAIGKIRRRWQQQRLRELAAELEQAQRDGDEARLEQLLEEKTALSARLHRTEATSGTED
jgi:DNA primase